MKTVNMKISIPFGEEEIIGHLYEPDFLSRDKERKIPVVLVLHEITGITEHTKKVAEKFSRAGFMAIAPDLFGDKEVREAFQDMPNMAKKAREKGMSSAELNKAINERLYNIFNSERYISATLNKLDAWIRYLKSQDRVDVNKISVAGFSFGGWYAFKLAQFPDKIHKAVIFYGFYDIFEEAVREIARPLLGFYGELENDNTDVGRLKELVEKYNKPFEIYMCRQAKHSFFDETNPNKYNKEASDFAWNKIMNFLN